MEKKGQFSIEEIIIERSKTLCRDVFRNLLNTCKMKGFNKAVNGLFSFV